VRTRSGIADDPLRGSRRLFKRLTARRGPDHPPGETPCRVLVSGEVRVDGLRQAVASALGAAAGGDPIRIGGLAVRVDENAHAEGGDAGRWPLVVELVPVDPVPHAAYVDAVSALLRGLWERELRAVALCPFAEELPRPGSARRFGAPRV
jgi:hypothetical protein